MWFPRLPVIVLFVQTSVVLGDSLEVNVALQANFSKLKCCFGYDMVAVSPQSFLCCKPGVQGKDINRQ